MGLQISPGPQIPSTTNILQGDNTGNAIASDISEPFSGDYQLIVNQNTYTRFGVFNSNANASAIATLHAETDAGACDFTMLPAEYVTSGVNIAGSAKIASPSQLTISAAAALGAIVFTNDGEVSESARIFGGQTVASATSATLDEIRIPAKTSTVTGTTSITTAKGFNKASIYKPTLTDSSAVTITRGATLYIEDAPAVAGSVTLTNPYALWVDNGISRFDGGIKFTESAPTANKIALSNGTSYTDSTFTLAAPGAAGNYAMSDGTNWVSASPAINQATISNPTGTTDVTGVMMGMGLAGGSSSKGGLTTSASASGRVLLMITGDASHATIGQGGTMKLRFGTGTAPVNGAALTGTVAGQQNVYAVATTAERLPFCVVAIITGLSVSTAYWFDLSLASSGGASPTASLFNIGITAHEL